MDTDTDDIDDSDIDASCIIVHISEVVYDEEDRVDQIIIYRSRVRGEIIRSNNEDEPSESIINSLIQSRNYDDSNIPEEDIAGY
jgi:hypothetical protein